jgi:hypothetical protein
MKQNFDANASQIPLNSWHMREMKWQAISGLIPKTTEHTVTDPVKNIM